MTRNKQNLGYLGEEFQYKLIHTFMEDKEFFKDLNGIIDQNMFTNPSLKVFVGVMKEYYEKHETVPSYTMMGIVLNEKSHNDIEKETYAAVIQKLIHTESDGVDYVRELAEKFFKQQNIVRTANEILKIAGNGDTTQYERCVELLNETLNQGTKENLGNGVFDDVGETLSDDYRTPIPTGIGKLDEALEGGLGKGELGVIIGSSSFGKAQPLTSKILTPNGWKLMGDMKVGDLVIGRDGSYHNVTGVFYQGIRPIYNVRFSNGSTCECDIEHLWSVKKYGEDNFQTLTLKNIIDIGIKNNKNIYNFQIPKVSPISFNHGEYVDDPYSYGYHLFLLDKINITYIKNEYFFNTKEIRLSFLQGLMDSCGDINDDGNCYYVTHNSQLCELVKDIIISLGGDIISVDYSKYIKKIVFNANSNFFKPFKNTHLNFFSNYNEPIYLISAEYVRDDYAQCIMVDSDEHLYITDDFIVTHNTSMTTAMASYAATYKCEQNNFNGFKVLQIVFEDRIKQIQRKHIGRITGIEAKDLSKPDKINEVKEQLDKYEDKEMLSQNLRIVRFPSGEMTAVKILRFIKKLINNGFKPDLCIIDYFECLSHVGDATTSNEYEKEGKTMRKLESMASELDIALWIPTQGTKDSVNMELVTMDKAGGSFKKIQIAHIVVSIARTMEDIDANKATIALLKNRAGKSGKVFNNVEFNNGTCRISTDNVDEFENMLEYNKNSQKQQSQLISEVYKISQMKKK